jgi:phage terminase large subunit-like protein
MTIELTPATLARWRADPVAFIEEVLVDPETRRPFVLLDAERAFLAHAFKTGESGKLLYPELLYSCPKKSGKTTFAAIIIITMLLLFGGAYAEAYALANDQEQARGRVFEMIRRIIEASPLLKREAKITESRIVFPAFNAAINAIASDAASAAGANPSISCFDELWAFSSERSRRLWDEMVPPPTRRIACRLTVTYAGFSGESLLLEELHKRGKALPQVGKDLYAGDGLLMFWSHEPIAPWQTLEWIEQMRKTLRPSAYARMIANEFAVSESAFVDMSAWDACTIPSMTPVHEDRRLHCWAGVDASVRRDSTALVLVSCDRKTKVVRLIAHKVFTPSPDDPINFEDSIEATLLEWRQKFLLRKVWFDPYQMQASAQRLAKHGVKIEEFPQTLPNLSAATSNLFDLVQSRSIMLYPDAAMRLAVSRAVLHESSRGWKLDKQKQHHKIDVVVALSMAALAAIRGIAEPAYDCSLDWVSGPTPTDPEAARAAEAKQFLENRYAAHLFRGSSHGGRRY